MDRVLAGLVAVTLLASLLAFVLLSMVRSPQPVFEVGVNGAHISGFIEFVSGPGYYSYRSRGASFTIPPSTRVRVDLAPQFYTVSNQSLVMLEVDCERGVIRLFHVAIDSISVAGQKVASGMPRPVLELYAAPGTLRVGVKVEVPSGMLVGGVAGGYQVPGNGRLVVKGFVCTPGAPRVVVDLSTGRVKGLARTLIYQGATGTLQLRYHSVEALLAPHLGSLIVASFGLAGIALYIHFRSKVAY